MGLFKQTYENLLEKPKGMYALDYVPPGMRDSYLTPSLPVTVVSEVVEKEPDNVIIEPPAEPIRLKEIDRTPDPVRTRLDQIRFKKMFSKEEQDSFKFSNAAKLIPSIIGPILEARKLRESP